MIRGISDLAFPALSFMDQDSGFGHTLAPKYLYSFKFLMLPDAC